MVPRRFRTQRSALRAVVSRRAVARFGAALGLAVLGAACGGGDSTRTAEPTTDDTTSVTVGIICTTPEDAVQSIVAAWGADDRAAANRCATPSVIAVLFRSRALGNTWQFQGCDRSSDRGISKCAFSYEGGGAFFTVEGTEARGWKATALSFVAD